MVLTNWTKATTDVNVAMVSLMSCINAGYEAWLELRENGQQEFPIMMKNPALDDISNWEKNYGTLRDEKTELQGYKFFNETRQLPTT